jgi:hypothetical protein
MTIGSIPLRRGVSGNKTFDGITFGATGDRNWSAKLCSAGRFLVTAQRASVAGSV